MQANSLDGSEFLSPQYRFPEFSEDTKILVFGLGGGCDIVFAYALSKYLQRHTKAKNIALANGKGPIRDTQRKDLVSFTANIYRLHPEIYTLSPGENTYGNLSIERSIPRAYLQSPLIISLPSKEDLQGNIRTLSAEIRSLGFDFIIGIDAGGDSLSGGIDHPGDPALGRDMQMRSILQATGIPFVHCVAAPCSDGETTFEAMCAVLQQERAKGTFQGAFSIESFLPDMAPLTVALDPLRTPNLVLRTASQALPPLPSNPAFIQLDRGIKPLVPIKWMLSALVFSWPPSPTAKI